STHNTSPAGSAGRSPSRGRRRANANAPGRRARLPPDRRSPPSGPTRLLTHLQRDVDLRVLALDEERERLARILRIVLEIALRVDGLAVHPEDHVSGLHARIGRRAARALHDQIALGLRLLFLIRCQRPHGEAERRDLVALASGLRARAAAFLLLV